MQTYDVTDLLGRGRNVLGALLADGWYRGQVGMLRASDQWGDSTALLAQLHVEHADGSTTVVGTDAAWRWSASHVVAADLIEGQREDRRCCVGWDDAFDADWQPSRSRPRVRRARRLARAAGARGARSSGRSR